MEPEFIVEIKDFSDYLISTNGRAFSDKFDKMKELKPCVSSSGYFHIVLMKNGKRYTKTIHRLVGETFLKKVEGKNVIDHINRIKTDNRLCNLRFVNNSENCINQGISKNNTSGVQGVQWHKTHKSWIASIQNEVNKRKMKTFKTKEEAIKHRLEMEKKYYKKDNILPKN